MWSGDHPGLQNRRTSVNPGVGAFDSHTLPPQFLRFAQDFGARLPLGDFAASLTPRKRLNFKTGGRR